MNGISWIITAVASFAAGVAASMGLGGGFVLLVYLTAVAGVDQLAAQWMNLIFFLPVGGLSLWIHLKNGLIEKKALLPAILAGIAGAAGGVLLANFLGNGAMTKVFAAFLAVIGLRELFKK